MGKIQKTKSVTPIKHLFDNYTIVQANCTSKVGRIALNDISYTELSPVKLQLNAKTTNLKMKYVNEIDVSDFYHEILHQPEDVYTNLPDGLIVTNGDLYENGTVAFSIELSADATQETFIFNDLKLVVLNLVDSQGVSYELLFSNKPQKNWLTYLMDQPLSRRNLVSLFGLIQIGLLYHSTGYELINRTNRSHSLSSQVVSNEPFISGQYDANSKQYHLTLVGTSIEFKQDAIKEIKVGLSKVNGSVLQVTLDTGILKLYLE